MKKLSCILFVIICISSILHAQENKAYIGGSLGILAESSTSKESYNGYTYSNTQNEYLESISGEFGYYFAKKIALGVSISYLNGSQSNSSINLNFLSVAPYAKFTLININNFTFVSKVFVQYLNLYSGPGSILWTIGISPGIEYKLSNKVSLETYFGTIGYAMNKYSNVSNSTFIFNLNNPFSSTENLLQPSSGLGILIFL